MGETAVVTATCDNEKCGKEIKKARLKVMVNGHPYTFCDTNCANLWWQTATKEKLFPQ